MPWDTLQKLLEESVLEKEDKLLIIDAIVQMPNENMANDIISLLSEWKATDDEAQKVFKDSLGEIVERYDQKLKSLSDQTIVDDLKIKDDIKTQEQIAKIKNQINQM